MRPTIRVSAGGIPEFTARLQDLTEREHYFAAGGGRVKRHRPAEDGLNLTDEERAQMIRRPRYRWTETGMTLDPKGAYVLNHMVPALHEPVA